MSIKLDEILKLNHFEHAKVLTDIPLQGEFPVEAISVQEYPAEAFVRNNEFILTTCMSCDEMDIFVHFIEGLCRLNVTAVAIAMGCYIEEIPREIIGIAERNNLVMITIPWEVAFSNIVEDVFNLLKLEKNLELEKY
ncbi:MAG: PucR family transcriptional regulator, partial [Tissierellia bacterium]|nr:PucR family transcriptional regulator [Tissierellia bacterium]